MVPKPVLKATGIHVEGDTVLKVNAQGNIKS